jgi:outer membrane protein OmpA-like peptidoglycan-associated protein
MGRFSETISNLNKYRPYLKKNIDWKQIEKDMNFTVAQCEKAIEMDKALKNSNVAFKLFPEHNTTNKLVQVSNPGENVNTPYADYAPIINDNGREVVFTSKREAIETKKNMPYYLTLVEDNYISKADVDGNYSQAEKYRISSKEQKDPTQRFSLIGLSNDGKSLMTFKDNAIWTSERTPTGEWSDPKKMDKRINGNSTGPMMGTISPDGKYMVFSSNKKGGKGGLDLYMAEKDSKGNWGKAKNLSDINTEKDEDFPFIASDGTKLYFSSNGQGSIGGYDIFSANFENGEFKSKYNLGFPVNSPGDDMSFKINNENDFGYFASNRKDGVGDIDIYKLSFIDAANPSFKNCQSTQEVGIYDVKISDTITAGTNVALKIETESNIRLKPTKFFWDFSDNGEVKTGEEVNKKFENAGNFNMRVEMLAYNPETYSYLQYCIAKNLVVVKGEDLLADVKNSITENLADVSENASKTVSPNTDKIITNETNINKEDVKTKIQKDQVYSSIPSFSLSTIYFDFAKYDIRPQDEEMLAKNAELLVKNPNAIVNIIAHADSRGSAEFNIALSKKRAKSAAAYLLSKGVKKSQIMATIGKGESELTNKCGDNVDCNEDEHAKNRRAEFILIGKK